MSVNIQHDAVPPVQLSELLRVLEPLEFVGTVDDSLMIHGIASDSCKVFPGFVFVAIRGFAFDGHRFMLQAATAGASVVLCEDFPQEAMPHLLYVKVPDTRIALAAVSGVFYRPGADSLLLVGVTGTNGKTTTARLICAMCSNLGLPAGYIGTNLCLIGDERIPLERTTPEAHELHSLFYRMYAAGIRVVVMEVSSHALVLHRVHALRFRVAVFTNLTTEHLDFHHTMEAYAQAKQRLFSRLDPAGGAVFNGDDPYAATMMEAVPPDRRYLCSLFPFSTGQTDGAHLLQAHIGRSALSGSSIAIQVGNQMFPMEVSLPGRYNVMNVLEAVAAGLLLGFRPEMAVAALETAPHIDGRMERAGGPGSGASVFIDYAHTPDALSKALSTLRELREPGGQLVVVFGCGGNRDQLKRPVMGQIACELADRVILTSDNPRNEDPERIMDEIASGMPSGCCQRIRDRREAVSSALASLADHDILLIAGKGHERYQEVAGVRYHFADQEVVEEYYRNNSCNNAALPAKESRCRPGDC